MNRKLTDRQITAVCRELLARDPATSGRAVRLELKKRFGSAGKTDRVFATWRMLREEPDARRAIDDAEASKLRRSVHELEAELKAAVVAREEAERRARLSEDREIAYQNRWANEIQDLRVEVKRLAGEESRRVALESRVLDLLRENVALKAKLGAL